MNKFSRFLGLAALLPVAAFAQSAGGVDASSLVTTIQGTSTPIGLVGMAVLAVVVGIATYKWIKRAI